MNTKHPTDDTELYQFDDQAVEGKQALIATHLPLPRRSGKVRDVYDLGGNEMLIVSTDRISAFDFILPSGIPGKGQLLTAMSKFWFDHLNVPNHLISTDVPDSLAHQCDVEPLLGRVMVVRKAAVVPFECVVRGYLEGSGLREYQSGGAICGHQLPDGLVQCDKLPEPIFTPATKAEEGHDENVSIERMIADLGSDLALQLRNLSLQIYRDASDHAARQGVIIADTKFEFGKVGDELILVDEVLTPDSSRFWSAKSYKPGQAQPSFDKQFVREWLSQCGWNKESVPPKLPPEVIMRTAEKYQNAYEMITGR